VVGCDLWVLGEFFSVVVVVGLVSVGVDVLDVGVLLMFVVVYLMGVCGVDFGVMLLVLYNVMFDNGIKFFVCGGYKFDDVIEDVIEKWLCEFWECFMGVVVGWVC